MSEQEQEKIQSLVRDVDHAVARLSEALILEPIQIHKDATVKRFEFTFELAWKLMQATVRYLGTDIFGPRESIRAAARYDLITDPEIWMKLLDARNITVHVYQESKADEVYEQAKHLPALVETLLSRVEKKLMGETPGSGVVG